MKIRTPEIKIMRPERHVFGQFPRLAHQDAPLIPLNGKIIFSLSKNIINLPHNFTLTQNCMINIFKHQVKLPPPPKHLQITHIIIFMLSISTRYYLVTTQGDTGCTVFRILAIFGNSGHFALTYYEKFRSMKVEWFWCKLLIQGGNLP